MALTTRATTTIAAPPAQVFAWLVEPAKLTGWLGAAGGMPQDSSELHAGWTGTSTMEVPGGSRPIGVTITAYDPPWRMSLTVTYDGGRSVTSYTLAGHDGGTHLTVDGDTDFATADTSRLYAGLKDQPVAVRWFARVVVYVGLFVMKRKLARGAFDDATETSLNTSLQGSLDKLKTLVETSGGGPRD